MARGTVVGEQVVSQANTKEFDAGYARTFGERTSAKGGRWVWRDGVGLVAIGGSWEPERRSVPVVGDSHYDGMRAQDGADISSRRKHREYMRAHGVTTVDDFKNTWAKQAEKRAEVFQGRSATEKAEVRKQLSHEFGRIAEMPQARYDRELAHRVAERNARMDRGE